MRYVTVTALSHTGLIRDRNEDSLVAGPWTLCGTVTENPQTLVFPLVHPLVIAVADGMGGQPGGEVASELTVRQLSVVGATLNSEEALRNALHVCNEAVYAAAERNPALATMGTTVAGVLVLPETVLAFNVGDSKVLSATPTGLRQLSVDDSPPLAPGRRTTSLITQSLGGATTFTPVTPHITPTPLSLTDRYLACTDGLTDPVPEEALDELLQAHGGNNGKAAFELWKAAIEAGGPDNITLALVEIGE
ncbi:PP2C family protein-serine/threonine phosphatase [Streptomyces gilvosporeus]|uniref:Serine/threonine protein phosphatase n=1 Tax=Streptomyces gilvosporeus TaxID=553510 RepID=A0A1V0TTG3_9ACTN|nr:PP2C family serine/threonine-protein phosphatase [Streptomyces gilvosporeus]ARF56255.1 serine/threonine protein phosphatase [Streptomyces gilvosporeus]